MRLQNKPKLKALPEEEVRMKPKEDTEGEDQRGREAIGGGG